MSKSIEVLDRKVDMDMYNSLIARGKKPHISHLYAARGLSSVDEMEYKVPLEPSDGMGHMKEAVDIIVKVVRDGLKVVIVGDYDVDGATSTAICMRFFREYGVDVKYLIPSRFKEGYGISRTLVDEALRIDADVIITVDNGVVAFDAVRYAVDKGLTVVVTDHHAAHVESGRVVLPCAHAVVNPVAHGNFKYPHTCGAGVIFYTLHTADKELRDLGVHIKWGDLIQLVGLATVCDMVPLHYNNRLLVLESLKRVRKTPLPGVQALLEIAGVQSGMIDESSYGFFVGPRINAAGRLNDMSVGVETLLSSSIDEARDRAADLQGLNTQRRDIESEMLDSALGVYDHMGSNPRVKTIVAYKDDWHEGVVGLLASRLKERYARPVIALCLSEKDVMKGSARSIDGFNIRDALSEMKSRYPESIIQFGGHAMAAGLSIPKDSYADFSSKWTEVVESLWTSELDRTIIWTDGEWRREWHNLDSVREILDAGPWGTGFPSPVYRGRFEIKSTFTMKEIHSKFKLKFHNMIVDGVKFRQTFASNPSFIDCTFSPAINRWNGSESIQFMIHHIHDIM